MAEAREIVALAVALVVAAPMVGAYVGTYNEVSTPEHVSEDVMLGDDGVGQLSATNTRVGNLTAKQSLGTALRFSGANDSELQGGDIKSPGANWTVTTWARLNESANASTERRVMQIDGWLFIDYNASEWRITYYDTRDLTVHRASIPAPSPKNWTHLAVRANETQLTVYRNTTAVMTRSLASGGATVPEAANWYGTVEETRVFNDRLSHADINATFKNPTRAVQGGDELARVMFDMWPGEATVDVYWTDSSLQRTNTTVVSGFEGEPVSRGSELLGGDYKFNQETNTITVYDSGVLADAPVVFVTYDANVAGALSGVTETVMQLVGLLLGLLMLASVAVKVEDAI